MKVVIIEDEKAAAENLNHLLVEIDPTVEVDAIIDTVSGAVEYFKKARDIELAFFDIHLADGNSFDIFKEVEINTPIIFTTAYDEYALKAFKVNSIDYILKPIDEDELIAAFEKYKYSNRNHLIKREFENVLKMLGKVPKKYKSTFLVNQRDKLIPIDVADIAYITIDASIVKAVTFEGKIYIIYEKLEDIEASLNPENFFRANRQFIVQRRAILNLTNHFNGKLVLNLKPISTKRIIISKAKAPALKKWMI